MSSAALRRIDKQMSDAAVQELLRRGYSGRLATVGADGWPYVVPLLYVWLSGRIYTHNSQARGHLRTNIERDARACFEIDEPGDVFAYGRFECDTALSYTSVVAFGEVRIVSDQAEKSEFCRALMEKYANRIAGRAKDFFPRLDHICVYAMHVERITGKETPLPVTTEQWPTKDRTRSPDVIAP